MSTVEKRMEIAKLAERLLIAGYDPKRTRDAIGTRMEIHTAFALAQAFDAECDSWIFGDEEKPHRAIGGA